MTKDEREKNDVDKDEDKVGKDNSSSKDGKKKKKRSGEKKRRCRRKGSDIKIMTVTWNMGNAMSDCFDRILPFKGGSYDVIALGLQESTYTIKYQQQQSFTAHGGDVSAQGGNNQKAKSQEDDCVLQLVAQTQEILTDDFYMVAHNKRAQMQQLIYARNEIRPRISDIKLFAENTGFFHIFPNKGGLCVKLSIDSTRLEFISCHLAAHEGVDKCAIRNSSVEEILSSVSSDTEVIHHSFFMGDMNYRSTFNKETPGDTLRKLEGKSSSRKLNDDDNSSSKSSKKKKGDETPTTVSMEDDSDVEDDDDVEGDGEQGDPALSEKKKKRQAEMTKLYTMITKEKWPELLGLDELTREMDAKRVLCGYKALTPAFPPTFKRIRDIGIQRRTGGDIDDEDERDDSRSLSDVDVDLNNDSPNKPNKAQNREYNLSMSDSKGDSSSITLTKSFYHHKRLPSYTDRILTSSLPGFESLLEPISFKSCEDACSSDHKPVAGAFKLTPRTGLKDIMSYSPSFITQGSLHYTSSTTFSVKELKASDLTEMDPQLFGGGSDPYCTFSADPAGILVGNVKKMRTRTINHDLNPNWVGDQIKFSLATNDNEGLARNGHFIFSVWDYDVGNPDDLIGSAAVPLATVFEHYANTNGADFEFNLELLRKGRPQGFLSGKIEVQGMKDSNPMVAYTSKKELKTLHETLKMQQDAAAKVSQMGCQCLIS